MTISEQNFFMGGRRGPENGRVRRNRDSHRLARARGWYGADDELHDVIGSCCERRLIVQPAEGAQQGEQVDALKIGTGLACVLNRIAPLAGMPALALVAREG